MPLVRAQVRNEYGLGMPELYKDADKEDPKALLDGVAVAGLVGILRQLGDLAEFAAEVFHGLQEQVMNTSSRSNKLMVRAQNIEAAYSPLEKTLLAQRSHLHFAYTSGSHWKAHIQSEQNHFIHSDLPLFIMDSYEECRGPPRLHLLDKFDTGGPGSCLKRYSDPTFFKRASAGFEEAYAENFPRDKKARRRKKMNQKKRTWIQNGDKPQRANHGLSDRMHYASQNFDGQTSPSQTVSTYDAASKLEMEDHSNSFGSKTASGYGECVSSPIYNIKFDGCEPDEISSQLTMNISDTIDTSSLEEQRGFVDNDVEEQTGPRSSCVTWDEKTEIMEPIGPQNHSEETMEVHTNLSLDPLKGEAANIKSDYCSNESMPKSVSGANQLDDNESETDNYMDALNTIESESETDLECQTKGKLKQSLNNIATDRSIDRLNLQYMNITSSNIDSPVHVSTNVAISEENHNPISIQTDCISSEETFISKPSSVTSECYAKVQSPHDTGKSLPMESLPFSDDITSPNPEAVDRNLGSLDSTKTIEQPSKPNTVLSSPSKSQKSPTVASGVTGINFWTNGVLLGLQPSKPSDFSTLDSVNHESMVPSSQSDILEGEESASKPNILRNSKLSKQDCSSKCTTSSHHDEEDIISIMKTSLRSSQAHSDRIPELTINLHHSFSSNQSHSVPFPDSSTMVHETEKRDNPDARTFIEQFGSESPFISPSSSPPLEHMKISFQPINGVDISKLKLKFPDGNEGHDCSVDVFSSFQLVPEESTSFQDVGSDSDGDTFCESSPHGSEDCLSHYSESDSEEWETRESPRCNDNDIYDALWGNSAESVSSNLDVGRITQGVITNKSGIQNLFTDTVMEHSQTDLPNFDILNGSFRKELHSDSETKYQLDSDFSSEPTPPPPPLPPMEWRGMKPNPDMGIVQQLPSIQALEHDFYKKLSTSTISQQPKPAPVKHDNTEAIACTTNSKHPNGKKFNVKKDADQSLKSKVADEKEDFLQQIRTKSFSLRRTTTERPNLASSAAANVSVTAILEKANAIRQAVGSDEGEDDDSCWSED